MLSLWDNLGDESGCDDGHWHAHTWGLPWGLPEVFWTVQVDCSRGKLLRRGQGFHVCTINKRARTKKFWKHIWWFSYFYGPYFLSFLLLKGYNNQTCNTTKVFIPLIKDSFKVWFKKNLFFWGDRFLLYILSYFAWWYLLLIFSNIWSFLFL